MSTKPADLANIDKVCQRFSAEIAGLIKGEPISGTPLQSLNVQVGMALKRHGMVAGYGPVRSSFERAIKTVEFMAQVQSFEITSQELLALATGVSHHMRLDVGQKKVGGMKASVAFGFDPTIRARVKEARFSYSGSKFTAVTGDRSVEVLPAKQLGSYNADDQIMFMSVISCNMEALVHEVLHSKVPPDAVQHLDAPINRLGSELIPRSERTTRINGPRGASSWSKHGRLRSPLSRHLIGT